MPSFSLSDTQEHMIATARDFGRQVLEPAEVALDKVAVPDEAFASQTFKKTMAAAFELGFHKMTLSQQFGGLGLDQSTAGLVWEELARYGPGFAASLMAGSVVPALIAFLAPDNKRLINRYVTPFCEDTTGTQVTAWGSSEAGVGSDGKNYDDVRVHHRTTAELKSGGYLLNGTKSSFVSNGGIAATYVVFACTDKAKGLRGSGAFVVPADAPGVSHGPAENRIGLRALNRASITMDAVSVPEDHLIFPPGDGYPMLHHAIMTVGNLGTGYLALGLMRAAFEEALQYAKERVQGGRPIVEHQLVAKKLFDIHAAIESTRALLWKGSWHTSTAFPGDLKTSVTAKILATQNALEHTAAMVQVLGGYGITRDYKLEKYLRDAQLLPIMDGTNDTLMLQVTPLF
jgi:alkylation response protein AidB-like acyl-CoA dehydrogenase